MAAELNSYIQKAREKKLSDEQITKSLLAAGWPADQVTAALAGGADLLVPPPAPSVSHVGMWTGFLYILFFISLYVLASSVAGIFHAWIDKVTPVSSNAADLNSFSPLDLSPFDWLSYFGGYDTASLVRGYMAAIFVSYPLFLILAITLKRQLIKNPMVKNLRSRKILIYITLIGTFLIMLGEIISTGYNFLAGSFTDNTIRHVLVTFLIAGTIFAYYISEVINDRHIT